MKSREIVAQKRGRLDRRAVDLALERNETAGGLRHRIVTDAIVIRSPLTPSADRHVHDVRLDLAHVVVAEAPFYQRARTEILHDDIGGLRQLHEDVAALSGAHVERQVALVSIHRGIGETDWRI